MDQRRFAFFKQLPAELIRLLSGRRMPRAILSLKPSVLFNFSLLLSHERVETLQTSEDFQARRS